MGSSQVAVLCLVSLLVWRADAGVRPCERKDGFDGTGVGGVAAGSFARCSRLCRERPDCACFASQAGRCYFKDECLHFPSAKKGLAFGLCEPPPPRPTDCRFSFGKDGAGDGALVEISPGHLTPSAAGTFSDCSRWCKKSQTCRSFVKEVGNFYLDGTCYFKNLCDPWDRPDKPHLLFADCSE